ncbi:hypothetical protein DTL42_04745 [Bremerella cremea]|uniref:Uncharacterized protein n=1 Tax=Bremerella cremea TaxID=1031537 RepID=A0A368KY53_9BACT|nr:hypothetical protein [Bremerella cremea]RCS54454.1 hypothetical protein DTL42_04745 [Bremerella cremea]
MSLWLLLTSQANLSWLSQDNITESRGDDLPATLTRLSQFGLVELFRHQNSKLLDKPLVTRTELMHRLEEIAELVTAIHATLFTRTSISNDELIVFYGIMRRRSVEFDLAILGVLTEEERSRVAKLVSLAMPVAIEKIKQDNEKLGPFGFENDR